MLPLKRTEYTVPAHTNDGAPRGLSSAGPADPSALPKDTDAPTSKGSSVEEPDRSEGVSKDSAPEEEVQPTSSDPPKKRGRGRQPKNTDNGNQQKKKDETVPSSTTSVKNIPTEVTDSVSQGGHSIAASDSGSSGEVSQSGIVTEAKQAVVAPLDGATHKQAEASQDGAPGVSSQSELVKKRGRGRPRKNPVASDIVPTVDTTSTKPTDTAPTKSTPTESTDTAPSKSTDTDPSKSTDTAPTESTDTVPSKSTDTAPTESTDNVPSKSTDTAPSKSTDNVPSKSTDTAPTESTDTVPSKSTDTVPTESTDTVPSKSTDNVPSKSTDTAPTESTDATPAESVQMQPTAGVGGEREALPSESPKKKGRGRQPRNNPAVAHPKSLPETAKVSDDAAESLNVPDTSECEPVEKKAKQEDTESAGLVDSSVTVHSALVEPPQKEEVKPTDSPAHTGQLSNATKNPPADGCESEPPHKKAKDETDNDLVRDTDTSDVSSGLPQKKARGRPRKVGASAEMAQPSETNKEPEVECESSHSVAEPKQKRGRGRPPGPAKRGRGRPRN